MARKKTPTTVTVILYRVDCAAPEVISIENTLEAMNALVGGYIEGHALAPNLMLICNEDGRMSCAPNRYVNGLDYIHGDFFISRNNRAGETISVTDADIELAKQRIPVTVSSFFRT